jgi:Mg2+ and Co2+ transporter CorA
MLVSRERFNAALALCLLAAFVLGCAQLKNLGGGGLSDANKLIDSANKDLTDIEKIAEENKGKESAISKQLNKNDVDGAKESINDAVKAIDEGLAKGKDAADKFDKASKLNLDSKVKEYLSLKAQSVKKTVDAFTELRKGLVAVRDNLGSKDKAAVSKAQKDVQTSSENYDKLMADAQKLERQADDIARENPDKIKG